MGTIVPFGEVPVCACRPGRHMAHEHITLKFVDDRRFAVPAYRCRLCNSCIIDRTALDYARETLGVDVDAAWFEENCSRTVIAEPYLPEVSHV